MHGFFKGIWSAIRSVGRAIDALDYLALGFTFLIGLYSIPFLVRQLWLAGYRVIALLYIVPLIAALGFVGVRIVKRESSPIQAVLSAIGIVLVFIIVGFVIDARLGL